MHVKVSQNNSPSDLMGQFLKFKRNNEYYSTMLQLYIRTSNDGCKFFSSNFNIHIEYRYDDMTKESASA